MVALVLSKKPELVRIAGLSIRQQMIRYST